MYGLLWQIVKLISYVLFMYRMVGMSLAVYVYQVWNNCIDNYKSWWKELLTVWRHTDGM